MPKSPEFSRLHPEQNTESHLETIQKFFEYVSFMISPGYRLEEIKIESGSRLTLDSLRSYILGWELEGKLSFRDSFSADWNIVRHRLHKQAPILRLPLISLDLSYRHIDKYGEEHTIPFLDDGVGDEALIPQLFNPNSHWNYFSYLQQLQDLAKGEGGDGEHALLSKFNRSSPQEREAAMSKSAQEPILHARKAIASGGMSVYLTLSRYRLIGSDGSVLDQDERIKIDPRWYKLMPQIHALCVTCSQYGFTPQFVVDSLTVGDLLFPAAAAKVTE